MIIDPNCCSAPQAATCCPAQQPANATMQPAIQPAQPAIQPAQPANATCCPAQQPAIEPAQQDPCCTPKPAGKQVAI